MKNIVLTSGTSGIGKAIFFKIFNELNEDCSIIVNYGHNENAVKEIQKSIKDEDAKRVFFVKADLSTYEGMESFVKEVKSRFDCIDWLILNTGIDATTESGKRLCFGEYNVDVWEKVLRTNLTIPAFLVQNFKNLFNTNGKILFMASYAGVTTYSGSLVYSVSKAAVIHMAKSLLKHFDDKGVCINAVAPGFIETPWQKNRTEESYSRINNKIACHRFGTPEEVADLSYSILTNDYLNGSVFEIHGGYDYF